MAGRVVTRERLMSRLFDLEDGGSENALELLVSRVRRKITGARVEIVTVRGVGYLARDAGPDGNGPKPLGPNPLGPNDRN